MTRTTPRRRDVLRAVGTTGLVGGGFVGVTGRGRATPGDGSRIVEVGLSFDVPDRDDYHAVHADHRLPYSLDPTTGTVSVADHASTATRRLFERGDVVVVTDSVRTPPVTRTASEVLELPVELTARCRVLSRLRLAAPTTVPSLTVRRDPDGRGRSRLLVRAGDVERRLSSPGVTTLALSSRSVRVRTVRYTSERVDDATIPAHRRALTRETDTVTVEATPFVVVNDLGPLSLVGG
ncbi:MAG: hypothetical protein ACQETI_06010 [Halobacteriota archaeon]